MGLARSVIVAPSNYGHDNACLLNALTALGKDSTRGVALLPPDVDDAELDRLHRAGVRGMRIYLGRAPAHSTADLHAWASRATSLGWHLQLVGARAFEPFVQWEPVLFRLACPLVIDHLGHAPQPDGQHSRTAGVLRRLLDRGKTYVKLSGAYLSSQEGFPAYSDVDDIARALVRHAPERMLWGSDWPHVGAGSRLPDGSALLNRLATWAESETIRQLILVDNPQRLYWG